MGTAVCWGEDDEGQTSPPTGERFTALSSGARHTCALRDDGTAVCWGQNDEGQASPPAEERFTAISSGAEHTCGLRMDGTVLLLGRQVSLVRDTTGRRDLRGHKQRFVPHLRAP